MKVIVVGAGFTGEQLARVLVAEGDDVRLVERDHDKARHASNMLDCTVLEGSGNDQATLREAGVGSADALVALTESDEMNIVSSMLVKSLNGKIKTLARVRNLSYYRGASFNVDVVFNPDEEAECAVLRALELGAAGRVIDVARSYCITELEVTEGDFFDGVAVADVARHPEWKALIAYVDRDERSLLPCGSTVLAHGDRIGVLSKESDVAALVKFARLPAVKKYGHVVIFGADNVGRLVAERMHGGVCRRVSVVDWDGARCRQAKLDLRNVQILCGDMMDEELIREENLDEADALVAASGNYDRNLIVASYMKSRGVSKVIALTASSMFNDVASSLGIDVAVPMRGTVVDAVLSRLRGQNVLAVHTVCRQRFEVVKCVVSGKSPFAGKAVQEIASSGEWLLLLRESGKTVEIPHGSTVLEEGDCVTLVTRSSDKRIIDSFCGKV